MLHQNAQRSFAHQQPKKAWRGQQSIECSYVFEINSVETVF
uniref:Uncharacterized protein n=1 Tax=Rhizophora mucronata TaxID=61149 RepID=A0A2P2Q904_RHIMU